jgi:polysaccharide transporter, PST family
MSGWQLKPFDSRGLSLIESEASNVRNLAVQGAGLSVLAQALGFVIQLVGTMVLARLLMPTDFGVVTMVTMFAQLLSSIGLNGFTEAVIQREKIDHFLASNLFWINLAMGLCLTFGFACCRSALARFYHEPRVASVCIGISASIFLYSASVVHLALLKRAMCFSLLSINDIIARLISVALSIALGMAGWGYWTLVAQFVAWPLLTCLGAWYQCRWIPAFPRRVPGTASMVRFATNVYSHFIISYAGSNTDNILVGWRFQAGALGFYKKAYDLFVLPANQLLSPVGAVAMSALSKFKHDPVQFKRHFLMALSIFAFIGMGISADLTLVGRDAVRLLLGAQWDESGRIFMFFGPGIGVMLLWGMHGWIHVSIGRADRWFRWGVVELIVTVLLFLICLHWGPVGLAAAWSASFWILFLPALWYAGRPIHLGIGETLSAFWKYVAASLLAGVISAVLIGWFPSLAALSGILGASFRIFAVSLLFGVLYLVLVIILHRGPAPIHQLIRLTRDMLPQHSLPKRQVHVETPLEEAVPVPAERAGGDQ